jgi:hypothetical protein
MHVSASRLLLAAIFAVGLTASAALAGGDGGDGKGSPRGTQCPYSGGDCARCDKPCQSSSHGCKSHACQSETCPEEIDCDDCSCDDECCDDDCCCEGHCNRCSDCQCQDDGDDDDGDDEADDGDDDGDDVHCAAEPDDDCCCDGWFFGNWFKSWNAPSHKPDCQTATYPPCPPCPPRWNPTAQSPYQPGHIHGRADCQPIGTNAWGSPCGVIQAGADDDACQCECGKCQCSKAQQTASPGGCAFKFHITCPAEPGCCTAGPGCCAAGPGCCTNAGPCCPPGCCPGSQHVYAPVPPPPPMPTCPVMGPHPEMFHKLAEMMAENAALHARLQAREDFAHEQEALHNALIEARQEIVRLTAAQQTSGNRDQVLVEWIKSQSEAATRKDEMLLEIVGAVVEMHGDKTEGAGHEKLEAKIEKLEAAMEEVKEENARLRTQVSQHKRAGKRVSTPTDGASCHPGRVYEESPVYKVQGEPVDCPK